MRSVVLAVLCSAALALGGCGGGPSASANHRPVAAHRATKGVQHRTVHQRQPIPYRTRTTRTAALRQGDRRTMHPGRPGVRITTFRVTIRNGVTTARRRLRTEVVREPVPRVVLVGTLKTYQPRCDSNYTGGCVPVASDVDCRGGGGDGPQFVRGPVRVVGHDRYGLDSDGNGWGCG